MEIYFTLAALCLSTGFALKPKEVVKIVAGIDFGTSFSGYAYSFGDDPSTIFTRDWSEEGMFNSTKKVPSTDTILRYVDEKRTILIDMFSLAINHAKEIMMKELKAKRASAISNDVHWVFTVPAIRSDVATRFMQDVAENAGININSLKLVLDLEAASLYYKTLNVSDIEVINGSLQCNPVIRGQQYIIMDLGGGTADITVHETLGNVTRMEVHSATGGALSGNTVKEIFKKLMLDLVGQSVMMSFARDYRQDYVNFLRDFESKIRLQTDRSRKIVLELPTGLSETLLSRDRITMKEAVLTSDYSRDIEVRSGKMRFNGEIIQRLFKSPVDCIVAFINKMKFNAKLQNTNAIVLTGLFSKFKRVVNAIKENFPDNLIVTTKDVDRAVPKGAVLMSRSAESTVEKVTKYTYEIKSAWRRFYEGMLVWRP